MNENKLNPELTIAVIQRQPNMEVIKKLIDLKCIKTRSTDK